MNDNIKFSSIRFSPDVLTAPRYLTFFVEKNNSNNEERKKKQIKNV